MWQLDWTKLADILTYDPRQPMIFSSGLFLFLFLGFSLVYVLLQKHTTARLLFVIRLFLLFLLQEQRHLFFPAGNCHRERLPAGCTDGPYRNPLEAEAAGRDKFVY